MVEVPSGEKEMGGEVRALYVQEGRKCLSLAVLLRVGVSVHLLESSYIRLGKTSEPLTHPSDLNPRVAFGIAIPPIAIELILAFLPTPTPCSPGDVPAPEPALKPELGLRPEPEPEPAPAAPRDELE